MRVLFLLMVTVMSFKFEGAFFLEHPCEDSFLLVDDGEPFRGYPC